MNALTKDLIKLVQAKEKQASEKEAERKAAGRAGFRQKLHLMPPAGWLNDPNGLCEFGGLYHAFFQYSPFDAEGGLKMWGHYTSKDMLDWKYEGVALYPDQPFDCHGVYSGAAFAENGRLYMFYTGNVKLEDQAYDYVTAGREANTVLTVSEDGFTFGAKQLLMKNADYPEDDSCHVRDPKVWKSGEDYYMIQGARTKEDVGEALVFQSGDLRDWKLKARIRTEKPFGYMWECPDYFEVEGKKILSASVQGLQGKEWEDRNVYQSGYFCVEGELTGEYRLSDYELWDYGFDYYAPQSFQTEDGRTIHIGWMGMPDCEEYTNLTIADGWQHCFTIPREIHVKDGKIIQCPVRELEERKKGSKACRDSFRKDAAGVCETKITGIRNNSFRAVIGEELLLAWENGRFAVRFADTDKDAVSGGRSLRYKEMEGVKDVKILMDVSSVEVFVNGGETVFSTRFYPKESSLFVEAEGADIVFSEIE